MTPYDEAKVERYAKLMWDSVNTRTWEDAGFALQQDFRQMARTVIDNREQLDNPREYAEVTLFKPTGKFYTTEAWRIPTEEEAREHPEFHAGDMVGPYCMKYSPDFHRIDRRGTVLVHTQEPWGYPHLFPNLPAEVVS